MRLKKFRIRNYSSIVDSGECYLASDMTILAGKNESGKTAIMEALQCFNVGETYPTDSKPLGNTDADTSVALWFEVERREFKEFFKEFSQNKKLSAFKINEEKIEIGIEKLESNHKLLPGPILNFLTKEKDSNEERLLSKVKQQAEKLYEAIGKATTIDEYNEEITNLSSEVKVVFSKIREAGIRDTYREYDSLGGMFSSLIDLCDWAISSLKETKIIESLSKSKDEFINNIKKFYEIEAKLTPEACLKFILGKVPKIFLFNGTGRNLKFETRMDEAMKDPVINDLTKIADFKFKKLDEITNEQGKNNYFRGKSDHLSKQLNKHRKKNDISILIERILKQDNIEYFVINVEESRWSEFFKPEQRSAGLRWGLSFYLYMIAKGLRGENSIILIDEPGLHLHASSQKDVLSVLERMSKQGLQIIFSTHSPYLIEADKLNRIRLVLKKSKKKGTVIQSKIHKDSQGETLTPIITSIGLRLGDDIAMGNRSKNVILEGISDYYYLTKLHDVVYGREKGSSARQFSFIPCTGATTERLIASIFIGWGIDFVAVLDMDREGRNARENIENLDVKKEQIIFSGEKDNTTTEDIFSHEDFNKYVLDEKEKRDKGSTLSNSEYIKKKKLDKVLMAKEFSEREEITLSKETRENVKNLFDKIYKGLKISNPGNTG